MKVSSVLLAYMLNGNSRVIKPIHDNKSTAKFICNETLVTMMDLGVNKYGKYTIYR